MRSNQTENGWQHTLRALQYRNYRLFFGGQGISLIGTWMQRIAMSWLVYRITDSSLLLGIVGFAGQIPIFLIAPFAGVLADRWNRRRLVIITQALAMIQAFVLASLVLSNAILVWQIIMLSIFLGFVEAFDVPTRQSFMIDIVEKKNLGNAIALNSAMLNSARLIGPSIAGILIALLGEGACFLLNGVSYLVVIISLICMRIESVSRSVTKEPVIAGLKEGFSYVVGFAPIRSIMLLLTLISLVGGPYTVLLPVFAKDILHGGPHTLGFLMGFSGLGALAGTIYLASRSQVRGLERMIAYTAGVLGCGLIAFSFSEIFWISYMIMLVTGFGWVVQLASCNTVLQTIVEDDKRGRVMSFYTMASKGTIPIGSLLVGSIAEWIGAPNTLIFGGLASLAGVAWFVRRLPILRRQMDPLFEKIDATEKGIK